IIVVPPFRVGVVQSRVCPLIEQPPWLVLKLPGTRLNDAGRVTSNVTFGAFTLPVLFLVCHVNSTLLPTAGPPLLEEPVVWMSALTWLPPPELMLVVELAELFAVLMSVTTGSLRVAVAELVIELVPAATVTFTVAVLPATMPPSVQLKLVPTEEQAP